MKIKKKSECILFLRYNFSHLKAEEYEMVFIETEWILYPLQVLNI